MASATIAPGQGQGGFTLTPSDSTDVVSDAGNTKGYLSVFVHNPAASGLVKITTADGDTITPYILQGTIFPVAARRVWATPAPPAGLIAIVHKQ